MIRKGSRALIMYCYIFISEELFKLGFCLPLIYNWLNKLNNIARTKLISDMKEILSLIMTVILYLFLFACIEFGVNLWWLINYIVPFH